MSLIKIVKILQFYVSETTLLKALTTLGLFHRIARRRPFLKIVDRTRRLAYALKYRHWTVEDWKRIIWTDESSFHVGARRGSVDWIWRTVEEEFHADCINFKKRESMGTMFWGCFRWGKMGPGVFFRTPKGTNITSTIYRDQILLGPLQAFWTESFLDVKDPIIMEDNAPVHKGVCVIARKNMGCETLSHPPNSPDLNPIENIWAHIKYRLAKEYPFVTARKELEIIIMRMWEEMADDRFNNLVESMPRRIAEVIKAKGGSIKY
jgi:DDE superfamily endonuclease